LVVGAGLITSALLSKVQAVRVRQQGF